MNDHLRDDNNGFYGRGERSDEERERVYTEQQPQIINNKQIVPSNQHFLCRQCHLISCDQMARLTLQNGRLDRHWYVLNYLVSFDFFILFSLQEDDETFYHYKRMFQTSSMCPGTTATDVEDGHTMMKQVLYELCRASTKCDRLCIQQSLPLYYFNKYLCFILFHSYVLFVFVSIIVLLYSIVSTLSILFVVVVFPFFIPFKFVAVEREDNPYEEIQITKRVFVGYFLVGLFSAIFNFIQILGGGRQVGRNETVVNHGQTVGITT